MVLSPASSNQNNPKRLEGCPQHMQDPDHLDKLAKAGNIAVVLGKPSGGLVSLDFDDEGVLKVLQLQPKISQTLITRLLGR